jgi:hypothetical protein
MNTGQSESRNAGLITDSPVAITSTELEKRDGFFSGESHDGRFFLETPRAFVPVSISCEVMLVAKINSLQLGRLEPPHRVASTRCGPAA